MSEPETSGIGTRLRAARERRGWSREALAFHSEISWSAITQIEAGRRRNVRPGTLSALSGALGVTVDYLVRGGCPSPPMLEHHALVYDTDEQFLATAGPFLAEGRERGEAMLAVTTKTRLDLLREHLGASDRTEFVESGSWYGDPGSTLDRYRTYFNDQVQQGAAWMRIIGEPVWEGRSDSEVRRWTRYESLLNVAFAASPVTFLCPYGRRSLDPEIVRQAHLTHPHVAGADGLAASPDYEDPTAFVLGSD